MSNQYVYEQKYTFDSLAIGDSFNFAHSGIIRPPFSYRCTKTGKGEYTTETSTEPFILRKLSVEVFNVQKEETNV